MKIKNNDQTVVPSWSFYNAAKIINGRTIVTQKPKINDFANTTFVVLFAMSLLTGAFLLTAGGAKYPLAKRLVIPTKQLKLAKNLLIAGGVLTGWPLAFIGSLSAINACRGKKAAITLKNI